MSDEIDIDLNSIDLSSVPENTSPVPDMCNRVEASLRKIDLGNIAIYTRKVKEFNKGFNSMNAPMFLRDFIIAYDCTNVALSRAIQLDLETETMVNMAESIAYMDNAAKYLRDRNIKDSSEARKRYVCVDPDVVRALNMRAKTSALVSFLKNKLHEFRCAHDDVKKIAYVNSDSQYEGA